MRWLRVIVGVAGLAACSASPAPVVDAGRGDGAAGDVEAPCSRPPSERPAGGVCVREVRGRVLDLDGAPRPDTPVTVCGAVCWLGRTDSNGLFAVEVGDFVPIRQYSVLAHARPDHATVYVPLPDEVGAGEVISIAEPIRVPRYAETGGFIDGDAGVATAGSVTVTVPSDARVEVDLEDFKLGELGRRLRVVEVPVERAPPFAREGRVVAVWALAPFAMTSTRPLGLRLPNTPRLPAGSAVDLVAMGGDILPPGSNAGRAVEVGRGRVTQDGAAIESDPGEGPTLLTWIGVRARSP